MIQVNISEIKNRLSYYLRLVRGGEQIEIMDRKTPLARIIHVSQTEAKGDETPWIKEMEQLGVVAPPKKKWSAQAFLTKRRSVLEGQKGRAGVLKALLEERSGGR